MRGRYERPREKKPFRGKKVLLIILAVVLALIIGAIIFAVVSYNSMLNKITKVDVPKIQYSQSTMATETEAAATDPTADTEETAPTATTEPPHVPSSADYLNILVVGQAAREDEVARQADTMILCTINTYENTLTLTSFLRDSYTKIPTYKDKHGTTHEGRTKLTNIYHLGSYWNSGDVAGSMELMNLALYSNFGIEVDYNFEINFDLFMMFIDRLYGVDINLTPEEADYLNSMDAWVPYDVQPGWFNLDGAGALCYARMRKAAGDSDSDIKRTARQRHLIEQVIARARTFPLSDLQNIINDLLPYVTTSMTNAEITKTLLTMLPKLPTLQIQTGGTCPVAGTYTGTVKDIYNDGGSHSILEFDAGQQKKLMRAITEGEGLNP